jgi:hypothetical protein
VTLVTGSKIVALAAPGSRTMVAIGHSVDENPTIFTFFVTMRGVLDLALG